MSLNLNKSDRELENDYQEAVITGQRNEKKAKVVLITGLFILLGIIPLIIGYFGYQSYISHVRVNDGAKGTATLDNNYRESRSRTGTRYQVTYSFTVNEKTYFGSSNLTKEPASNKVVVLYEPDNPNNNKLEGAEDFFERMGTTVILALILGLIANLVAWGTKIPKETFSFKSNTKRNPAQKVNFKAPTTTYSNPPAPNRLQISSDSILWIEKDLLRLNKEISGEDRPKHNPDFFQVLPKILLTKDHLSANDVAEVAIDLVRQTRQRFKELDIPFRKPRVEFTTFLPNNEPGHIEFGEHETIIRVHPSYNDNPFALASILCHELAHFVLDQNGIRKTNRIENEKLTDLFVFRCGQGLIYLQGILDITSENGQTTESKLGYLSLEEMAYAHVRCSSQNGLPYSKIAPDYFSGKVFEEVKKATNFLTLKQSSTKQSAEIILCPNDHILRISTEKKSQNIRCPKCKWEKEIWLHVSDQSDSLMNKGIKDFDSGNFNPALETFRKVQEVDKTHSNSYCWASRCLKKLGRKQDAIRELQKLLSFCPNDEAAQAEMKTLIYS